MKRIATLYCILLPMLSLAHNISQDFLWKGYAVRDSIGQELKIKRQSFIKVNQENLFVFQFRELLSKKTGAVVIKTIVDTFIIQQTNDESIFLLKASNEINSVPLQLNKTSEREFEINYSGYIKTFKLLDRLEKTSHTLHQFSEFIVGSTLIEVDPDTPKITGRLWQTYQNNGRAKYRELGGTRDWESAYIITEFQGYIFLKGITSAPLLLTEINENGLHGFRVDYRKDPESICLSKSANLSEFKVYKSKSNKPFEIDVHKTSVKNCVSRLSSEQLTKELTVYGGVSDDEMIITQVQHAYGCSWILFNENGKERFKTATIETLISLDSSICFILDIPCGYYAERESRTDDWYVYLHEERLETDSSFIFKKAFRCDNTYRVINKLKKSDVVHYTDYRLDTRIIRKTWTYKNGTEVGITRVFDETGNLIEEVNHSAKNKTGG